MAGKQYCTNCGYPIDDTPVMTDVSARPPDVSSANPPSLADSKTAKPAGDFHGPAAVLDLRQVAPQPTQAVAPVPAPAAVAAPPEPAAPVQAAPLSINVTPEPAPAPTPAPAPAAAAIPINQAPAPADSTGTAPAAPSSPPIIMSSARTPIRLSNAQAVTKSPAIQKFQEPQQAAQPVQAQPQPAPAPAPAQSQASGIPTVITPPQPEAPANLINAPTVPIIPDEPVPVASPTVNSGPAPQPAQAGALAPVAAFQPAPLPTPSAPPQPAPLPTPIDTIAPSQPSQPSPAPTPASNAPISSVMPGIVATNVQANQQLLTPTLLAQADPETARKEAFALAIANAPKRPNLASVAAAGAAVLIMGGYVWMQNAPKLAIKTAASKAGFEASLPTYLPSNFSLERPINSAPGKITLAFSSPSHQDVTITQQKTDWDSQSLLDNYVSKQADNYLTVEQQGLKIYLYNGDSASWVNRGIWYSIQGHNQLDKEQLLKIAYGL